MSIGINSPDLNDEQKKAAFCDENAVIAAGAGSGKTRVLANRFVWLLTEKGFKTEEILTLTFTKKAAAEMFRRIYFLVLEASENETGIKAQRAKEAINDFIHARIQTIDSYCASIVRQCAPRYGINPDFRIDQERCRKIALEISYPFFIAHRSHPAIEKLYSANRPNDIVNNIFAEVLFNYCQIDKPRDFLSDIKKQFNIICVEWEKQTDKSTGIMRQMENELLADNDLFPALIPILKNYKKSISKIPQTSQIRGYFDLLLNIAESDITSNVYIKKAEAHPIQKKIAAFVRNMESISGVSLKKGKRTDNPVKEKIKLFREVHDTISTLAVSCMQAGFLLSIMTLFTELQTLYLNRKRAEGTLTYSDIASLARTILIEQEDIRQSEKETFKAIMIDEFQDNNELQKDILFLLAEKHDVLNRRIPPPKDLCHGKLFFVGDEKQSIYLFRGADVSVFRKLKDELKSSDLPLKINYRSAPRLIGAFNTIFGGNGFDPAGKTPQTELKQNSFASVFAHSTQPDDSLPLFEAAYTPIEAGVESKNEENGKITFCILNSDGEEIQGDDELLHPDESEARFVAEKIKQLLNEKTEEGNPKYQCNDIAILFRTGTPQFHFEKHLRILGIPYACENITNIFYGGLVNDIMSVLRLVSHPKDRASYAEMLRSPFAGLSIAGTTLCLSTMENENNNRDNYSLNSMPFDDKPLKHLDKADSDKYLYGKKVYSAICKKAETECISSLVSELWYNEGYRYETEWNPQTRVYREMFDYFFHHAAAADTENKTLASFTDSIIAARNDGSLLSENELPLERPSAVRLTTIHRSKGLEYPVVFLCCCGRKSRSDRCDAVYISNETGIAFSPPAPEELKTSGRLSNFFWDQASEETKRKRIAELRRLLYVGMTRAEKELFITGSLKIDDDGITEDFSLKLKNFINEKTENNANYIDGDSIWNNDTFFGLLLPSVVSHIPKEGFNKEKSFFNLEEIPSFTDEYINKQLSKNTNLANNKKGLNEFINKACVYYENAEIIKTPILHDNHLTPVSLKDIESCEEPSTDTLKFISKGLYINREFSGGNCDDVFNKVDFMITGFSQHSLETAEKFNYGSFGTIAHICVAALLKKEEAVIPSNIAGFLTPVELTALLEAGNELARRFLLSPLGKTAEKAKLQENEFPFRSLVKNKEGKEIFINGTVDLFFEDNDFIHIVDFKIDSKEFPSEHIAQMACYYHAISTLIAVPAKKECRIWLYYLRSGHAVEVTEKAKQFNIGERAFFN